jgi:hypothetical protein
LDDPIDVAFNERVHRQIPWHLEPSSVARVDAAHPLAAWKLERPRIRYVHLVVELATNRCANTIGPGMKNQP